MFKFRPVRRLRSILVTGALLALLSGALFNGKAISAFAQKAVNLRTGDSQVPGVGPPGELPSVDLGTIDPVQSPIPTQFARYWAGLREPNATVFGVDPQDLPFVKEGLNLFQQLIEFVVGGIAQSSGGLHWADTLESPPDGSERTIPRMGESQEQIVVEENPPSLSNEPVIAQVSRVIDGDTIDILLNDETFRVRYIGVNTPETDEACFEEATAANGSLVAGQTVSLFIDTRETDQYGRLLRYVYVGDLFVNARLVAAGYAEAVAYPPDPVPSELGRYPVTNPDADKTGRGALGRDTQYADYLETLETEARAAGLGCHASGVFD